MARRLSVGWLLAVLAVPLRAEAPPFLPAATVAALAQETSGEAAKRNLELLSREHRMRGSRGFHTAAQFVAAELRRYGLADAEVLSIPADGEIFYGTQRSRRAWDAEFAELWELRETAGEWQPVARLASWDAIPLSLAQDSESGEVTADLVDIGAGTAETDYAGRDVRGRLVLTSSQPEAVVPLAVARFGAAGIVSAAQNQRTAWWGDDDSLVRWGHAGSFNATPTFAFMVALKTARGLSQRLAAGERVRLHAVVRAGQHPGAYEIATATIPGADPALHAEEIVFSCHLDHPRPGANDNASGCAAILEVARTLGKLRAEGKLAPTKRTLRFVFPPEVEGTMALLHARPELATRARAAIHLDMVGGGPATKATFHVTRGPASLPSFVHDVAAAWAAFANRETARFAATGRADWPLSSPEGGKEPLQAELADYSAGSDHDVWNEGSFRVPAIYFNDWPDRYIHTTGDVTANIDPTKLKRAAFLAAASALVLADCDATNAPALLPTLRAQSLRRLARLTERRVTLPAGEAGAFVRFWRWHESEIWASLDRFTGSQLVAEPESSRFLARWGDLLGPLPPNESRRDQAAEAAESDDAIVFRRNASPKGPMSVFGYDYLRGHLDPAGYRGLALPEAAGGDYAYEALNLVDGRRPVQAIRDALTAIYGPVPLDAVSQYLRALERIGVLTSGP